MGKFSITTNDGHGHGDDIGALIVAADNETEAIQAAYRCLAESGDYDTIVVSADLAPAAEAVTA